MVAFLRIFRIGILPDVHDNQKNPSQSNKFQGKELKHGENGVEISGADGYFRVVIPNCQQDIHEGEIIARASNEHGTAESRARLTVEIPEEESRSAPTFLKDIEDQVRDRIVFRGKWLPGVARGRRNSCLVVAPCSFDPWHLFHVFPSEFI